MSLGMLRYDHERQLLREWASNRQVDESLNAKGLFYRDVAQFGSAPDLGSGGRKFESCRPDHAYNAIT